MTNHEHSRYYVARKPEMLEGFDEMAQQWAVILARQYDEGLAREVLQQAREEFEMR